MTYVFLTKTDSTISFTFSQVNLSKGVSQKLKEKKSDATEDETIQFKSYLLSFGISDPVTKAEFGSGSAFHTELAKQLSDALTRPLQEAGGILSLTEVCLILIMHVFVLL